MTGDPGRDKQIHARISGRVQGVGFRYFVQREANRLGLMGWVRNLRSGDVEMVARGPTDDVDAMVAHVRRGPQLAWVQRADIRRQELDPALRRFEIRPADS